MRCWWRRPSGLEPNEVTNMSTPLDAPETLNREFLEMRARLLAIAASLDRLDRAEGSVGADARLLNIRQALAILAEAGSQRAERIQLLFSRPYEADWKAAFELSTAKP